MKIAWLTPYSQNSAIAKFSSLVVEALTARDYSITLVSSDELPLAEYLRPPPTVEILHWSHFGSDPDAASDYDLFVYNIGDHFPNHAGVLSLIDHYPGVCIFHDFYLVNLFLAWCAKTCERPAAHSIVSFLYGEELAKEFWDRGADADFQEWSASHTPMTGWVARKALAAVAHAPFYEPLLTDWCAGPVKVIPLAYTASADASDLQVQRQNGHVRILTVGTVNPNKRVESVIQTIARSAVLRTRCKYDVIGKIDVKERIRMLSLIERLGLRDLVHLHGSVSDFELCYRYAEAEIVCCLRWPALEGASASCIEAMSYGKAVIVTDTGFYASIPPDLVVKVKPTHESEDLAQHLEMLVVDAGARGSLGRRAREWARFEYAPDAYAARIEPLLAATVKEKAATNAFMQIGANLRAMSAEPDEPIVQLIGSEFHSLLCGSEGRIDAIKWTSDTLQVAASPEEGKERGDEPLPASGDTPTDAPLKLPSRGGESVSGLSSVSESAPSGASLKSGSNIGESPGEPLPPATVLVGDSLRRFVGSCTEPIRTRLKRYSPRHFLFRCAEPILSHLKDYFLGDLVNLTESGRQRILEVEQSVGALRQQAVQIQKYTERLAQVEQSVEALRQQAVQVQRHTEGLARRGDVAVLADHLAQLESQLANANWSIDVLTNRNVLVLRNELLARTPYGYLFVPIDDSGIATFLLEGKPWEQEISALLDLILKPGMTFVDIGANVGFHTLHGARAVGISGAVFAFEPAPKVFQSLQRSIHLNGLDAICRCMNLALSSSEGLAAFHVSAICGRNSLYPGDEEEKPELEVKTARLDSVLIEARRIDVVKMDVEGAELDVLEGMKHILDNHRDIVLIVEYGVSHLECLGINPADWFRRFFAHGFALFAFDEQADTWREVAEQKTSETPSVKVVFVRPGTSQWSILKQHEV